MYLHSGGHALVFGRFLAENARQSQRGDALVSSSALRWFGEARRRYGSRGTAALVAVLLDLAFIYLLSISFRLIPDGESPAAASIVTRLIEQPRGRHSEAPLPSLNIHLSWPVVRVPDTPPNIRIDIPLAPVQQHSEIQASSPPGSKQKRGADPSHGIAEEPAEGAGAAVLHQVGPAYGAASVKSHEQGVVALRVLIDSQGKPMRVRLAQSSGFLRLDRSAIDAVKRYRFTPPGGGRRPAPDARTASIRLACNAPAAPRAAGQSEVRSIRGVCEPRI